MKLVTSLVAVMALFGFSSLLVLIAESLLGRIHTSPQTANLEACERFCDTCQHDGKEWDEKPCSDCSDTDSMYERRDCRTCRYNGLKWYEEPCDSCCGGSGWEAIS